MVVSIERLKEKKKLNLKPNLKVHTCMANLMFSSNA